MIKRRTWKLSERPESYGKHRKQVHPPAKKWEEIPNDQANLFLLAKGILCEKTEVEEAKLYAYGSRVNGNFVETSDIDIAISGKYRIPNREFIIKGASGNIKIDIKQVQPDPTIHYIEIP